MFFHVGIKPLQFENVTETLGNVISHVFVSRNNLECFPKFLVHLEHVLILGQV
jgi:hypothetical protein